VGVPLLLCPGVSPGVMDRRWECKNHRVGAAVVTALRSLIDFTITGPGPAGLTAIPHVLTAAARFGLAFTRSTAHRPHLRLAGLWAVRPVVA
jgi:hypothetical protein